MSDRTYTDARVLREDLSNKQVPETVIIEVSTELLASFLGQRVTMANGEVVSMEQVRLGWDAVLERVLASPVVVTAAEPEEEPFPECTCVPNGIECDYKTCPCSMHTL